MPKRRTLNLKQFQGSTVASSSAAGQDGGDSPTASVNERLADLRKLESLDAQQKKRELAESANQRSVPPELRGILGVAETAPPKPKIGVRLRERMRTPGPPPPKSWLVFRSGGEGTPLMKALGGKHKGKGTANGSDERNQPKTLGRFARMTGIDDDLGRVTKPLKLTHLALRRLAEQWDLLGEEDYPALVEIPLRLRLRLLSYIAFYGPVVDVTSLQALTQGPEETIHLDLGGLAGHAPLALKKLCKVFEMDKLLGSNLGSDNILDSWDVDESLAPALHTSRFSHLAHLCLSHPPSNVSWRDLLAMTKHVPQLTHLSLAYWPRPTLTPNLATSTVSSLRAPDVHAGGSHYYSGLDHDYSEAAALLRQLSNTLLCLQWLDLEGCGEWAPALGVLASLATESSIPTAGAADFWDEQPPTTNVITGAWKNLKYINVYQGWMPALVGIEGLDAWATIPGHTDMFNKVHELVRRREAQDGVEPGSGEVQQVLAMYATEKRRARVWFEGEAKLHDAGRVVNSFRRLGACVPVVLDFGWTRKVT